MLTALAFLVLAPDPLLKAFRPEERAILAAPDRVVLVQSDDPLSGMRPRPRPGAVSPRPRTITRTLKGRRAVAAVEALRVGLSSPASIMKCFNPRLRVTAYRGQSSVSMMICFECQQIAVDHKAPPYRTVAFSPKAAPLFDRLLK